jgi:hypothetical protein
MAKLAADEPGAEIKVKRRQAMIRVNIDWDECCSFAAT